MKLDLDWLGKLADQRCWARIDPDELAALVRIARAAVAWRDAVPDYVVPEPVDRALLDALRKAGL